MFLIEKFQVFQFKNTKNLNLNKKVNKQHHGERFSVRTSQATLGAPDTEELRLHPCDTPAWLGIRYSSLSCVLLAGPVGDSNQTVVLGALAASVSKNWRCRTTSCSHTPARCTRHTGGRLWTTPSESDSWQVAGGRWPEPHPWLFQKTVLILGLSLFTLRPQSYHL